MPPKSVPDAPAADHDWLTPDLAEAMWTEDFPADLFPTHGRIGFVRLGGGRWIVGTPTLDIYADDLNGCGINPLARRSQYPLAGRPTFGFDVLTDVEIAGMRARARALADIILGIDLTAVAGNAAVPDGARWVYSDPAQAPFGTWVPDRLVNSVDGIRS